MEPELADSVGKVLSHHQIAISDLGESSNSEDYAFANEDEREAFWLKSAGVPPRYQRATIEGVVPSVRETIQTYCNDLLAMQAAGRGLLISGPVGTGKSCVLALVARAAYDHFVRGKDWIRPLAYLNCADLYRAFFDREERVEAPWWTYVPILLLDELGTAYDSEFAQAQLDWVVERRYSGDLLTCVVTNLSIKALREEPRWRRVYDRLREGAIGIELTGVSRRGKAVSKP